MVRSIRMPTESNGAAQQSQPFALRFSWPVASLLLGLLLIASSFLPLSDFAARSAWTTQDTIAYDRLSLEYHRSAYQSPARVGLTKEEFAARQQELKQRFDAMRGKLEYARQRPDAWRRYLLGGGAALSFAGALGYLRQR